MGCWSLPRLGLLGLLVFPSALLLAWVIRRVNANYQGLAGRSGLWLTGLLGALLVLTAGVDFVRRRTLAPGRLPLIGFALVGLLGTGFYFCWVNASVFFPADILMWAETDFVNDILKFRLGHPLYTPAADNECINYVPGAPILTYLLASLAGQGTSLAAYRTIQVFFCAAAAVVAARCCRTLLNLSRPGYRRPQGVLWSVIALLSLFLVATNSLTNTYVHNLDADALAQFISMTAFWLLLEYVARRGKWLLVLMAVLPAAGFLVRQNLAIWVVLYCAHLAFFDRPRSLARLGRFALAAFGGLGAVAGAGYWLWGEPFIYWVFTVLRHSPISALRSAQHLLQAWPYVAAGLAGGLVLLRPRGSERLLGPWLVWLVLILTAAYTSGVGWAHHHLGPASLIAGVWFLAAVMRLWPLTPRAGTGAVGWLRVGLVSAPIGLVFFPGMGIWRTPDRPLVGDAFRYVREIEGEFQGIAADRVLLDFGTWVYVPHGVVMKDRSSPICVQGQNRMGDFSGIRGRLCQKYYSKILVRGLQGRFLWYDWCQSTGLKRVLLDNYRPIRTINKVAGDDRPGFGEITVLVPKVP
jgi:hypothetical protein